METTQRRRRWLEALKGAEHERSAPEVAARDSVQTPNPQGAKSAETLDAAIAWRVEVMRPQIPQRGPIPFLVTRPEAAKTDTTGHCGSCGDPLLDGRRYRCAPCQAAAWQALNEVREGVPPEVR
jgi:hypothetical protein